MGRVLLTISILLLSSCVVSGVAALRAWSESRDAWGLLFAAISLTAGISAQRMFEVSGDE